MMKQIHSVTSGECVSQYTVASDEACCCSCLAQYTILMRSQEISRF